MGEERSFRSLDVVVVCKVDREVLALKEDDGGTTDGEAEKAISTSLNCSLSRVDTALEACKAIAMNVGIEVLRPRRDTDLDFKALD